MLIRYLIMMPFIIISMITDIKSQVIKNIVVFPMMIAGLASSLFFCGIKIALLHLAGMVLVMILCLFFAAVGGIGMGDIKLIMGIASFLPAKDLAITLGSAVLIMLFIIVIKGRHAIGKVIANTSLIAYGMTQKKMVEIEEKDSALVVPFGLYAGIGVMISFLYEWIGGTL